MKKTQPIIYMTDEEYAARMAKSEAQRAINATLPEDDIPDFSEDDFILMQEIDRRVMQSLNRDNSWHDLPVEEAEFVPTIPLKKQKKQKPCIVQNNC